MPNNEEVLISLFNEKKYSKAIDLAEKYFKKDKTNAFYYNFIGNIYQAKGEIDLSIIFFERALEIDRNFFYALYNLGVSYKKKNLINKSKDFFLKAIEKDKYYYDAINNLGLLYKEEEDYKNSINCFEKCINIDPLKTDAYVNVGLVYGKVGLTDKAIGVCKKALQLDKNLYGVHSNLGIIYQNLRNFELAINHFFQAIKLKPDYPDVYNNVGICFIEEKKFRRAIEFLDKSIQLNPKNYKSILIKGIALKHLNEHEECIKLANEALKINPEYHSAYLAIAESYLAEMNYDQFMRNIDLADMQFLSSTEIGHLLFNYTFHNKFSSKKYLDLTKHHYLKKKSNIIKLHLPKKKKNGKIKIGFVSGDFRHHAVSYQLKDFFELMSVDNTFEVYAFVNNEFDDLTQKLKEYFFEFKDCTKLTNLELGNYIRELGIDILIDLSGFTKNSRLYLFKYRPCPIQISWCGWLAGTGMDEMDYFVGDQYTFPGNSNFEKNYTEKILKLDNCWSLLSKIEDNIKIEKIINFRKNNYITFGSFNNYLKYNDLVIETWSKILKKTKNSKLYISGVKRFSEIKFKEKFYERFSQFGVSRDQLVLEGLVSRKQLFENYNKLDIVLDPFPYNGGTTNLEAAYMCLPIITLEGDTLLSRCGISVNLNRGIKEWNCNSVSEYIEKAVSFANNIDYLQKIRDKLIKEKDQCALFSAKILKEDFKKKILNIYAEKIK